MSGLLVSLKDWRKSHAEARDVSRRLGRQQMLGMCIDAINACRAEKEALGTGSTPYWQALLDINFKLLEIQKQENP